MEQRSSDLYYKLAENFDNLNHQIKTFIHDDSKSTSQEHTENLYKLIDKQSLLIQDLTNKIKNLEINFQTITEITDVSDSNQFESQDNVEASQSSGNTFTEDNLTDEKWIAEIEADFLAQTENSQLGIKRNQKISEALQKIKIQSSEHQDFQINNIDCRVTKCKIEVFHPASDSDPEMVMMELITHLEDQAAGIEMKIIPNQDGSNNAVYYLSNQ